MKEVILNLLKKELFNKDIGSLNNVVWDEVWQETRLQSIGTLVFSGAKKCGVEFDEITQTKAVKQLARINKSFLCHKRIASILEDANIPYVIIKGVISSSYYPDPYARPMGDTDVLVTKKDFEKVVELFKNNGIVTDKDVDFNIGHHIDFSMKNQKVELHFALPGIPQNEMAREVNAIAEDIFEKAIDYDTIYGKIKGPSKFHHGLIMLLHMQGHMQRGGMGLRHLCDWAVFVNSFEDGEFISLFEQRLKGIGMWNFARLMCQVSKFIGLEQKDWMDNDEELSELLFEDIISCGNFGRKDIKRMNSSRYMPKVQEGKRKKSQLAQYFDYGVKATQQIWPFYKKHKWLLPVGFVGYCVFTAYKLATGKAKVYDLSEDSKRYDMYSKLKLFEK